MNITILDVKISALSKREILEKIFYFLDSAELRSIFTPNPEFLVAAQKDKEFLDILNKADLAIADGIGLVIAGILAGKIIRRFCGSDLIYDICRIAEEKNKSVFLLGGNGDTARLAAEKLRGIYPKLKIAGAEAGLETGSWKIEMGKWALGEIKNKKLLERINKAKPDIIFVAFGHPKQEKWIHYCSKYLPSVKIAMGVGGSFDFISGKIRRAPRSFRFLGLEWAWRLVQEPKKRRRRIYDAVFKFPLLFLKWRVLNFFTIGVK